MTLERLLKLPATSEETEKLLHSSEAPAQINEKLEIGNLKYSKAVEYINGQSLKSSAPSDVSGAFEAGTPGVMSPEEVESRFNLGQWRFAIRDQVVSLEVRYSEVKEISIY